MLAFIALGINAQPTTLKCKSDAGFWYQADIKLNILERTFSHGVFKFDIVSLNEKFLTMIQNNVERNVGGSIFVLNRITGDYQQTQIGYSCNGATHKDCQEIATDSDAGRCIKQQQF